MKRSSRLSCRGGFTLVELLVVIGIIIILMGLVLTASHAIKESQRRTDAKNTALQVVTALNSYYADYAKFPSVASTTGGGNPQPGAVDDAIVGDPAMNVMQSNNALFHTLRSIPKAPNENDTLNPRRTVYFAGKAAVLSGGKPRGGFFDRTADGAMPPDSEAGSLYDPWGRQFGIIMDTTGDERIDLGAIYSDFAGSDRTTGKAPRNRSGVFSMGKDEALGHNGDRTFRKGTTASDDVISWE